MSEPLTEAQLQRARWNAHRLAMKYDPKYRALFQKRQMASSGSAEMELTRLLLKDHRRAMRRFPHYAKHIEANGMSKSDQLEVGLRFQHRRFERQSRERHREIWATIRAPAESNLRQSPAGVGAFK